MPLEDIRSERIKKLGKLQDPYPASTRRTNLIAEVLKKFGSLAKSKKKISLTGRVMAKREHGGSMFLDVQDGTGKIQVYLKEDMLGDKYRHALDSVDIDITLDS